MDEKQRYLEMPPDPAYQPPEGPGDRLTRVLNEDVVTQRYHQPGAQEHMREETLIKAIDNLLGLLGIR